MTRDDPIASPTLAHLYISQGHFAQARQILETVLDGDPTQGHALALLQRLRARGTGSVSLQPKAGAIEVSWRAIERDHHAVVAVVIEGDPSRVWVTSRPCPTAIGSCLIPTPPGAHAATACVARVRPTAGPGHCTPFEADPRKAGFSVIATADPVDW